MCCCEGFKMDIEAIVKEIDDTNIDVINNLETIEIEFDDFVIEYRDGNYYAIHNDENVCDYALILEGKILSDDGVLLEYTFDEDMFLFEDYNLTVEQFNEIKEFVKNVKG